MSAEPTDTQESVGQHEVRARATIQIVSVAVGDMRGTEFRYRDPITLTMLSGGSQS